MSQYETGKFPIITTKITYSNFTDVFADKFPLSSYRVVMLDALFSGIACGRNRIFFSQVDALFYVSDIPFHRDVYSEWHHTGCDRMHFRLSQYNLPSYLDGTEEARELNSKLIDEFFKDKKLYKAFVNLADNSKKHYRYISSYDEANFYAYNEYYYAVCIKIGIIRNDSKFIKNQIEN